MSFIVAARKGNDDDVDVDNDDDDDDGNDDNDNYDDNDVGTRLIRNRTRFIAAYNC